ncbi:hypothetical protein RR48_04586 [Papilio machaon]|uniref:Uncharacterized protein n=1 Tax=Papilio machaon TaxID=76193 RepID=A0A0N0PBH0_PAPMA|nr:hypothetical protein RR48_04586 [Papilio machaon]
MLSIARCSRPIIACGSASSTLFVYRSPRWPPANSMSYASPASPLRSALVKAGPTPTPDVSVSRKQQALSIIMKQDMFNFY